MTDQEILEKAIQKAIDGGWSYPFGANTYEIHKYVEARPEVLAFGLREDWQDDDDPGHLEGHWSIPELIFNHDFAKALWGEGIRKPEPGKVLMIGSRGNINWMFHLMQMVIAGNPLEYLGEHI